MNSLVDFRNINNLSQKEMATRLGITLSMYSKVELGQRNPSYNFLVKFKRAFKEVNIDSIFFNHLLHETCDKADLIIV